MEKKILSVPRVANAATPCSVTAMERPLQRPQPFTASACSWLAESRRGLRTGASAIDLRSSSTVEPRMTKIHKLCSRRLVQPGEIPDRLTTVSWVHDSVVVRWILCHYQLCDWGWRAATLTVTGNENVLHKRALSPASPSRIQARVF